MFQILFSSCPKFQEGLGLIYTEDGRQTSESWTMGSGRIEKAVGSEAVAADIRDSIKSGRVETWVVATRADGSTEIQVVDVFGKVKNIDTSKILNPLKSLNGAVQ